MKCGLPGTSTKSQMIKAKKVIEQVGSTPSLIIVGYFLGNNLLDDYLFPPGRVFIKDLETGEREMVVSKEELRRRLEGLNFIQKIKFWFIRNSVIYNILRNNLLIREIAESLGWAERGRAKMIITSFLSYFPPDKYEWLKVAWSQHIKNILEFNECTKQIGSKLLFVLILAMEQVYESLWPDFQDIERDLPNRILSDVFEKHGIYYVDLTEDFRNYAKIQRKLSLWKHKGLYYKFDRHWNENGSYLAGLLVSRYI